MSTKVYQYCCGPQLPDRDQVWQAVTEHGEVICTHVSSNRWFGISDTGPTGFYADRYPHDAEVIVLDYGELPPIKFPEREDVR